MNYPLAIALVSILIIALFSETKTPEVWLIIGILTIILSIFIKREYEEMREDELRAKNENQRRVDEEVNALKIGKNSLLVVGEKSYISRGHTSIIKPNYIDSLIENIGIKKETLSNTLLKHTPQNYKLKTITLNNGWVIYPVLIYEKHYDGQEDSSYIEQKFMMGVKTSLGDLIVTPISSDKRSGEGRSWYYESHYHYYSYKQEDMSSILKITSN